MIDQMAKMYEGLTDQERGKLAYTYMAKGNDLERLRIADTMQDQYFIGLPDGYRRTFIELNNLSMLYAIMYWQQVAKCQAFMSATMGLLQDESHSQWQPHA